MAARATETETLLTPAEVAALFRVDPKTVTRWAKAGKLSSIRTLGGHRRYRETEDCDLATNVLRRTYPSGMSAEVTASKSGSSPVGVNATISASLAPVFWHRHQPSTPADPAAPPFSITRVALNPMSQPGSEAGFPTVTAAPWPNEA